MDGERNLHLNLKSEISKSEPSLLEEVSNIKKSLDDLHDILSVQQDDIARDFESRIRHVYDDVINDINQIRDRVNHLGNGYYSESELLDEKSDKEKINGRTLRSSFRQRNQSNLKGSKSVDFSDDVVLGDTLKKYVPIEKRFGGSVKSICASSVSIWSNRTAIPNVPGFGCCFHGDGKTLPYRSFPMWYAPKRYVNV